MGEHEKALQCYDLAIKIEPEKGSHYSDKAITLGKLKRYNEALECHDKAIELSPFDAECYSYRAVTLEAYGEFEQAFDSHNQALKLCINKGFLYCNRAGGLFKFGKEDDAIKDIQKALELTNNEAYGRKLSFSLIGWIKIALELIIDVQGKAGQIKELWDKSGLGSLASEEMEDKIKLWREKRIEIILNGLEQIDKQDLEQIREGIDKLRRLKIKLNKVVINMRKCIGGSGQ